MGERWRKLWSGRRPMIGAILLAATIGATACGADSQNASGGADERPTIVVSSGMLGDVVTSMVGDDAEVITLMPAGADPHEFSPSAQQVAELREADAIVVNGGGFEAGLQDAIDAARADGVPTFEAIGAVPTLQTEDGALDPHFFTDPARMATAAEAIAAFLRSTEPALATPEVDAAVAREVQALRDLDAEAQTSLSAIPADRRVLITNHEVFSYFADRYGFEVVGTVVPGSSTQAEANAQELAALAEVLRSRGVPVVFADTSSPTALADALAAEVPGVAVVELYSESLGEPGSGADTYAGLVRTNVERIVGSLS